MIFIYRLLPRAAAAAVVPFFFERESAGIREILLVERSIGSGPLWTLNENLWPLNRLVSRLRSFRRIKSVVIRIETDGLWEKAETDR